MGLRTHPCGVPICVIMLAVGLLPILTGWGLSVKKSSSQCVDSLWASSEDDRIEGDAAVHKKHPHVGVYCPALHDDWSECYWSVMRAAVTEFYIFE